MACSCCRGCQPSALDRAAGIFRTLLGQLRPGPTYSDQIAPAYPQPHRDRDGIPFTGMVPTMRVNAPANPQLILDPITAYRWYLRPMPREVHAPQRRTITPVSRKVRWLGRSG